MKQSSLAALKRWGISQRVGASPWRRERLLILCYHGVSLADEHGWDPGLYISPQQLDRRLALIAANGCTVLPLAEALARLYRGALPERAVVLTFDDGYYDFLAAAWSRLRAYGYPATVYLTTSRVDHNLPNVNLFISYALWLARDRVLDGEGLPGLRGRYPLASRGERDDVLQQVGAATVALPAHAKDGVARDIAVRLGLDYEALLRSRVLTLMRPDEVARLAAEGVDFQLHTHQHRTPEDPQAFMDDILLNQRRLQAMTGQHASHLCYPSGNYRASYLPLLRHYGIASATTCDPGLTAPTTNPLLIPRFVDTGYVPDIVFESWLTGVAARLPRRTRRGGYPLPPEPQISGDMRTDEGVAHRVPSPSIGTSHGERA